MVAFKNLSLLALAGSAIAAPSPRRERGYGGKKVVWHTVVHTAYVTVYPGQPTPKPEAPKPEPTTTVVYQAPPPPPSSSKVVIIETPKPAPSSTTPPPAPVVPSSTVVYEAPPVETPKPVQPPVEQPPTNTGYMAIVDEWRAKLGLKPLIHDAQLEANAIKTCREGNGQMVHQLNEGSMGQVLAPGGPEDFYHVFVGGWLCEKPNMAGMNGVCTEASKGWYYTSTGHADILTADNYSKIGCGSAGDITGCDLA